MTDTKPSPNLTARMQGLLPALTSRRSANIVFGVALVLGFAAMLIINRHSWFTADDFAYLYKSNAVFDKGDYTNWLLAPHNEHWAILPVVIFQVLFLAFGMKHFLPYLVPVLLAHVGVLIALRALIIRAGVQYWIATCLCISIIVFGGGAQNLNWAFQIGFVGSVMFGLFEILCVDHDGPIRGRDFLGLLLGFLAISTQGPGITVVIVATLILAFRRRFRAAALQAVPLAVTYLAWYAAFGHGPARQETSLYLLADIPKYIWYGITSSLNGLTQLPGIAPVLALILVGVVLVVGPTRRAAAAAALLVGIVIFFTIAAYGRIELGVQQAGEGRYVYVASVFAVAALALALNTVPISGHRRFIPAIIVIGWMTVANAAMYYRESVDVAAIRRDARDLVTAIAAVPGIDRADSEARPVPGAPDVSVGLTLRYTREGVLPRNADPAPGTLLTLANQALVTAGPASGPPPGARVIDSSTRTPVADAPGCWSLSGGHSLITSPGAIDVTLDEQRTLITTLRDPSTKANSSDRSIPLSAGTTRITNRTPASDLHLAFGDGTNVVVCGLTNG